EQDIVWLTDQLNKLMVLSSTSEPPAPLEPQARIYPLNPPPRYDEEYVNAINKLDEIEHGAVPSEPQASKPRTYKGDLHKDLLDDDFALEYFKACAIEGALPVALREFREALQRVALPLSRR